MNEILTCYFASKENPQTKEFSEKNSFEKIRLWYESVHKIGLNGRIFHDHLSDEFVKKYRSCNISFEKVEVGNRSVNDDRFYHYYDYLRGSNIDRVFLTDSFDVEFIKNPFDLFDSYHRLYVGDESRIKSDYFWFLKKIQFLKMFLDFQPSEAIPEEKILNAGIVGGRRQIVVDILKKMIKLFEEIPEDFNANMPILNLIIREKFSEEEILHGQPLNSQFKGFESEGNFAIRHK